MSPKGRALLLEGLRKKGWSYKRLATVMGVSKPTVTRWLNGERLPNRSHMIKLRDMFGIPLEAWLPS